MIEKELQKVMHDLAQQPHYIENILFARSKHLFGLRLYRHKYLAPILNFRTHPTTWKLAWKTGLTLAVAMSLLDLRGSLEMLCAGQLCVCTVLFSCVGATILLTILASVIHYSTLEAVEHMGAMNQHTTTLSNTKM